MKKIEKELVEKIKSLRNSFAVLKNEIADLEIMKHAKVNALNSIIDEIRSIESEVIEKHGKDAVVNLDTGEITKKSE